MQRSLKGVMVMKAYSEVTHTWYDTDSAVFFRNIIQAGWYVMKGATILDVFADSEGKLVVAFPRDEHNVLITEWVARKPKDQQDEGVDNGKCR